MKRCVLGKTKQVLSVPVRLPEELASASEEFLEMNAAQIQELAPAVPASKYHNARTEYSGMTFQSGREARRAAELVLLEQHRKIFGLRFQVRFPLPGGIVYVADATYLEVVDGHLVGVVEDTKGWDEKKKKFMVTDSFRMKSKMFFETYGIRIREV